MIYIYKLNFINFKMLGNLNKEAAGYFYKLLKDIGFLRLYNGKVNITYKIKNFCFKLKNLN